MLGPKQLLENENIWHTEMGAWFPSEGRVIFRGVDLFQDLQNLPWISVLIYGITGRIPSEHQAKLFEGIWRICTSYPDPRLWNNRVAALAGTARSTASLAISAANAVSEATIYGHKPIIRSIDFLLKIKQDLEGGADLTQLVETHLKTYRTIAGFGRPITQTDERIAPIMRLAEGLDFAEGDYVKLVFSIEEILVKNRWRLRMNIAALLAALAADQGMSRREYSHYMILCFSAGMFPCFIDSSTQPEGTFFPLRCARINCIEKRKRTWDS